jgi:2'-5' RNA ligase
LLEPDRGDVSSEYSVWLVPDRDSTAYRQLAETIEDYAEAYDTPAFDPHVTILGSISDEQDRIARQIEDLVTGYDPLELPLTNVHCSTTTHQCVFQFVDPNEPLFELHRDAVRSFDAAPGMYVPHVSLLYSDVGMAERVRLVQEIDQESLPETATTDTIEVVDTQGPVDDWQPVSRHPL